MRVPARTSARAASLATLLVTLAFLLPAAASAAERIVAIPQSTYATENVAIDQGEPLSFLNLDALNHDVTARGKDSSGQPLFSTPLIGTGQEVPVTGTDSLGPGNYEFFCTIHANMTGTLTIGGGGSGGSSGDAKGPQLDVQVLDKKVSEVRKAGLVRVQVTTNEGASMNVTVKQKKTRLGKTSHDFPESGSHLMEVKLSKSGKSALADADKAKLEVSVKAEDAAGNSSSEKTKATLK